MRLRYVVREMQHDSRQIRFQVWYHEQWITLGKLQASAEHWPAVLKVLESGAEAQGIFFETIRIARGRVDSAAN